jgi:ankyrin repeat protein
VVKVFIAAGAAVNRQSRSESPLLLALKDKNREITVHLLEHGADVNAPSGDRQELPIYAAIDQRDVEMVKLLIAHGAKLDQVNKHHLHPTPLHMAVYMQQAEIVNLLLEKDVPVDPLDRQGRTPLNQMLFNAPQKYLFVIGKPDEADANRIQIIKALLAHKADPNTRDENGMVPILYAMKAGSSALADALLAAGADINATDKEGLTALHYAVRSGNEALVARLLQQGFKVDQEGWLTPLNQASNPRIAEMLIQAGARVNTVDEYSYTPLARACSRNDDVAIVLLAAGANPNVRDNDGDTPLHVSFGYFQSG